MSDPDQTYLPPDDHQQMRHTWRMAAEVLGIARQAMENQSLPPAVIEHVLIDQYRTIFHGKDDTLEQVWLSIQQMMEGGSDDDDE